MARSDGFGLLGAKKPELFFWQAYRQRQGARNLENVPHGTVLRLWTGDPRQPDGEDMGNFYSAARDTVFFAHHANVRSGSSSSTCS